MHNIMGYKKKDELENVAINQTNVSIFAQVGWLEFLEKYERY